MYHFIVNKSGGSGKADRTWIAVQSMLDSAHTEYKTYFTSGRGDASSFAREITSLNDGAVKDIIVVGGDGTVNEVLNGITDFKSTRLGLIPTGSGNDFARGLGIPHNPREALKKILNSSGKRSIDLGKVKAVLEDGVTVKERLFGISAGIGLDAIVCKKALTSRLKKFLNRFGLGSLTYGLITLWTLLSMEYAEAYLECDGGSRQYFRRLIFIAFMNCKAEGGGVYMAPKARIDDGLISYTLAHGVTRPRAFACFAALLRKKHERLRCFSLGTGSSIKLNCKVPLVLHADGEYVGDVKAVEVKCLKGVLSVI